MARVMKFKKEGVCGGGPIMNFNNQHWSCVSPRRDVTLVPHGTLAQRLATRTGTRPPPIPIATSCPYRTSGLDCRFCLPPGRTARAIRRFRHLYGIFRFICSSPLYVNAGRMMWIRIPGRNRGPVRRRAHDLVPPIWRKCD